MKILAILTLTLGLSLTAYADYPAESYGANPSLANNTTAIQAALDDAGSRGGGVVTLTEPGVYLLKTQGPNPYAEGHRYCLEIRHNNLTLSLGHAVTLKLAAGQQTTEPVDIIVFRSKSNLTFTGGTITGNTAGQSWARGYSQIDHGIILSGYSTFTTANEKIAIKNVTLKDHFSNSINISLSPGGQVRNRNIRINDVISSDCGEGIQVISADDVWITDSVSENPGNVAVGDAIEISDVNRFHLTGNTARNHLSGSGFDIFGSRNGVVQNFIADGCGNGIIVHPFHGVAETENVLVDSGVIIAPSVTNPTDGVEIIGPRLTNITISRVKVKGTQYSYGFQSGSHGTGVNSHGPISIIDCEVTGAQDGLLLQPISELTIRGGRYSNNFGRGIVLLYVAGLVDADVANLRIDGVEASNNGSYGILIDTQGNQVPFLTGSITNNVLNNTAGSIKLGPESARLHISGNLPRKNNWVFWEPK